MPTTLPDMAARARHRRRLLFAELTPIVVAIFYVLLLAWTVATLETNFSMPFGPDQRPGDYNPMEPSHSTREASNWPGDWIARR
jgi:hypothetical protein